MKKFVDPTKSAAVKNEHGDIGGLTKREYLAAMAMQALLSRPGMSGQMAAVFAVNCADALIAELSNQPPNENGSAQS
jgi:hypothetical protein